MMRAIKYTGLLALCLWALQATAQADTVDSDNVSANDNGAETIVWIDVRTADEYADDHLSGAIHIPHQQVAETISQLGLDKNQPIGVYCRTGRRSALAEQALLDLGFKQVINAETLADAREANQRLTELP